MEMTIKNGFHEIQDEELMSVDGGDPITGTIGLTIAIITIIYGAGYAMGTNDAHQDHKV